jgi:hypothetical protein
MITLDAIQLPNGVVWTDEYDWSPTQQAKSYTLTGALVLETSIKLAGRPITLQGRIDSGWVKRSVVEALYAKLDDNVDMTLTYHDNRVFTVRFDHEAKPIDSAPVQDFPIPKDTQPHTLILRLLTV